MECPLNLKANAIGGHNALGLAKKQCKIILASTSEVYGDPLEHLRKNLTLEMLIQLVQEVFMMKLRFIESMTISYHVYHNLRVSIVRIFNTYGPRMKLMMEEFAAFIKQAASNKDLTINGDGLKQDLFVI